MLPWFDKNEMGQHQTIATKESFIYDDNDDNDG